MELISEPAFIEEEVIDLDVVYENRVYGLTLRPADVVSYYEKEIVVHIAEPPEDVTILLHRALFYSTRKRTMRRVVPTPLPDLPIIDGM